MCLGFRTPTPGTTSRTSCASRVSTYTDSNMTSLPPPLRATPPPTDASSGRSSFERKHPERPARFLWYVRALVCDTLKKNQNDEWREWPLRGGQTIGRWFFRPAAPSKEPKIGAKPSSHVISQPSISSSACQVLVLLHRPTISIPGPDGPSYPGYPPCLMISRPWFPLLCILWHLVYPQRCSNMFSTPKYFVHTVRTRLTGWQPTTRGVNACGLQPPPRTLRPAPAKRT